MPRRSFPGLQIILIPLMIGARDMAFPRLNAFSYWTFLLSGILLYISAFMGQSPHGGWFAYVPYTQSTLFARIWHGFLRAGADLSDDLHHGWRDQLHRDHFPSARSRHDDQPHAAISVQHADHLVRILYVAAGVDGSLRVSGTGPALGNALFRFARGGNPLLWQQLVLVFWASLGLRDFSSGHRHGFDDHSGFLAAGRSSGIRTWRCRPCLPAWSGFGVWLHHMFAVGNVGHGA